MAKYLGGPTPNGTEGIVCVTITTDKDPLNVKACIIRNEDQTSTGPEYLLLLPDIKCLAKELKEAEFYHFRKKKALPLKLDGDFEDHFKHQCLPCDFKDEALPQRRSFRKSFRKKSTTETVNNYLKKYCTLTIEQAKRGQLCKKEKSLFGLKDGGPNKRAEFLKLNMSKGKVSFDGRECLHPRGPLFHGYQIDQDNYNVKVVGSYYVDDDDEISIHLFVEEDNKQSPGEKSKSSVRVSGKHQSLQDGLQRNQHLSPNEPGIQQGQSDLQQGQEPMEQFQRADPQNDLEQLMKGQHQIQIQQHLDVEERNYMCITLLLYRVGLVKLRQFFINEWNSLGGFASWTDCPQNGADLLTKFMPLSYERAKVMSGDSRTWDISILIKALLYSRPPLVSESDLVNGLKCLKETRNQICHTGSGRIESSEFIIMYKDVCSALMLIGASSKDFKEVGEVLQQPWKELSTIMKHIASQDGDILRGIDIGKKFASVLSSTSPFTSMREALQSFTLFQFFGLFLKVS